MILQKKLSLTQNPLTPVSEFSSISPNRQFDYTLQIVFFGFSEDRVNLDLLQSNLIAWHAPIPFWSYGGYGFQLDSLIKYNYTLNYEFEFINDERVTDYIEYISEIGTVKPSPSFSSTIVSTYVPTEKIEEYLISHQIIDQYTPTLVIFDLYTINPASHFSHYYSISTPDWDNIGQYKIADGGRQSNTVWLDLSAGPSQYLNEFGRVEGEVNEDQIPPIWTYDTQSTNLHEDLARYIQTAVELKFIPSTPFPVLTWYDQIHIDFKVYSITDYTGIEFLTDTFFAEIVSTLSEYNPYAEWSYNFGEFELDDDTKTEFDSEFQNSYNPTTRKYDYTQFNPYLRNNFQKHFNINISDSKRKVIPVYIFNTGFTKIGANGLAMNGPRGKFEYVLSRPFYLNEFSFLTDEMTIQSNKKLYLHEISHALGLSHPFDGFTHSHYEDGSQRYFKYWLWGYTDTLMGYLGLDVGIATLDLSKIRQSFLPHYQIPLINKYNVFIDTLSKNHQYIPEAILPDLLDSYDGLVGSIESFTNGALDSYNTSLQNIIIAKDALEEVEMKFDELVIDQTLTIIGVKEVMEKYNVEYLTFLLNVDAFDINFEATLIDDTNINFVLGLSDYSIIILADNESIYSESGLTSEISKQIRLVNKEEQGLSIASIIVLGSGIVTLAIVAIYILRRKKVTN